MDSPCPSPDGALPKAIIAPSLLAADYRHLATLARRVQRAGADWFHVDIMDGHFVPNLTFGPGIVRVVRQACRLPLDVHLMCSRPGILLEPFVSAGARGLTIHVELGDKVGPLLWQMKSLGVRAGLAVNPPTSIAHVRPFLKQIDTLLVMTVNPGFGGQEFIEETVPKIQQAARWRRDMGLSYRIAVDGGITFDTAVECARAGADTFVSGTALFGQPSLRAAIRKMRQRVERAQAHPQVPSATTTPRCLA